MGELVVCPSGLSGRMRGMKVREERILADRRKVRDGGGLDALLAACWETTEDDGPYNFAGAPPDWGKVLQGDRFYALLMLRALTYGAEYAFSVCCRSCRSRFEWELDLRDLPVKHLPAASREAFAAGNRIVTELPGCGRKVTWSLPTGADEALAAKVGETVGDRVLSAMLAMRVKDVEGLAAKDRRAFLEDLSMGDAAFLMSAFEDADCGVDTRVEVECPRCLEVQDVDLPFGPGFLLPSPGRPATRSRT